MSAASCKWIATICASCFTGPSSASASDFPAENSRRDPVTHQEAVDTLATERYLLDDMAGDRPRGVRGALLLLRGVRRRSADGVGHAPGRARKASPAQATSGSVVTMPVKRAAISAPAWYRSAALPWAAAAALALVAGYQSLVVVPSLRQDTSPRRARARSRCVRQSRGAEAIVAPVSPTEAGQPGARSQRRRRRAASSRSNSTVPTAGTSSRAARPRRPRARRCCC